MFLNDNDCADVDAVYAIARRLFENSYKFYEPHIFASKTFLVYDAENYLLSASIGINAAWCRHIHKKPVYLFRTAKVAYIIPHEFVPINSPLMSFADVVTLFVKENHQLPVHLSAENLRAAGMLTNNALMNLCPKLLPITDSPGQTTIKACMFTAIYRYEWTNQNGILAISHD